ncbi:MAG TPA: ABC transporter ATP-binding protein [Alphaproteobacteria bacterium]|nr:ABC transporter ATP-binding protein [Alphaproteobacteria bacterium]
MIEKTKAVLRLKAIAHRYKSGEGMLDVLKGADLEIFPGEVVALVGPSGSGKSTLLHISGLLEAPTAGTVEIEGEDCTSLKDQERTLIRRLKIGFVYQFHHLLPEFSALENVVMPQLIAGAGRKPAEEEAKRLLISLGLGERLTHRPAELSGGEQQRVAIARGLANQPLVLLADEPTGNLDPKTSKLVFDRLLEVTRARGTAALVATHNLDLAAHMDRVVVMHEGKLLDSRDLQS